MSNYVAAIDFGTTKIVTIVGEKSAGGVKIVGYSEAPASGIKRGEVINIRKAQEPLINTLEVVRRQTEDLEGFLLRDVYVGISGQNIHSETDTCKRSRPADKEISEDEINDMLDEMYRWPKVGQNEKVLHVIPQSYNVDEQVNTPANEVEGMLGRDIEGYYRLIIGRTNPAKFIENVISKTDLRIKKMVLSPIASAKAVLTDDEKELGAAVIDIGGGTTEVVIIKENTIRHTAVIPFGGNSITEDIRQECEVSFNDAEVLKIRHGSCLSEFAPDKVVSIDAKGIEIPLAKLYKIIEARIGEILATVAYEIEQSGFSGKLLGGLVITGGSSKLKHIDKLANAIIGLKVRLASPDKPILMTTSVEDVFNPASSTAVGLILSGFELASSCESNEMESDPEKIPFPDPAPIQEVVDKKGKKKQKRSIEERFKGFMGGLFDTDNEA